MAVKTTTRKSMQHLAHPKYAMDPREFIEIVNWIEKQSEQKIDTTNAEFSEKADGIGIRFGLDESNRFFLESSRSGPQFDKGSFSKFAVGKTGKANSISRAFDDMLDTLDNSKIKNILKKHNENGIKVVGEAFYLPNAIQHNTDKDLIKFIATYYRRDRLGDWATVVVFDILDGDGERHPDAEKIKKELKATSDKNLIFDGPQIDVKDSVSFTKEIKDLKKLIAKLEKEQGGKIEDILADKSRKRTDTQKRKLIKQEVGKFQKTFSDKLGKLFTVGKFGPQFEGLVVKLANGIMFKITSDTFRNQKDDFKKEFARLRSEDTIKKSFKTFFKEEKDMKFKELINESLNTVLPNLKKGKYKVEKNHENWAYSYVLKFNKGQDELRVNMDAIPSDSFQFGTNSDSAFGISPWNEVLMTEFRINDEVKITGNSVSAKQVQQIFATVITIINRVKKTTGVKTVMLLVDGKEPSRLRLYRTLSKKFSIKGTVVEEHDADGNSFMLLIHPDDIKE